MTKACLSELVIYISSDPLGILEKTLTFICIAYIFDVQLIFQQDFTDITMAS